MIIVKSLEMFVSLIEVAKSKKLDHVVWGSEEPTSPSISFGNEGLTHFEAKYVLSCTAFTAYFTTKVKDEDKGSITTISKEFHFIPVAKISQSDGIVTFE